MGQNRIKLALVDDDVLLVQLLEQYLSSVNGYDIVITAYDGGEFIDKLKDINELPDIAIIDLRMEHMNGVDTVNVLKKEYPDVKVITLSSHYKTSFMGFMLKVGVNAFIPKGTPPQELAEVIHSVYHKGFYFMEDQIESMRNQISSNAPEPKFNTEETLSKREIEVLELICQQYSTAEIAEALFITKRTVEGHRNNLFVKTGVKNVAGLVIYALQKQLVSLDDFSFE